MAARKKQAAKKAKSTKAVVKKESNLPSTAVLKGLTKMAGAGTEDISSDDMKTPMVYIAQSLSPAIDSESDGYIEGCEKGDYYNTVSRQYCSELPFIVCYYRVRVLEWAPRDSGDGLQNVHEGRDILEQSDGKSDKNVPMLGENILVETAEFVGLADFGDGWEEVVFPLSGSGWNAAKTLNAMLVQYRPDWWEVKNSPPPTFVRVYLFSTTRQENNDGVWQRAAVVAGDDIVDDVETLGRAKSFYELIAGGATVSGVSDEEKDGTSPSDDDIPF